ncbi:hypothetical protein CMI47_15730 [Candidatus Pacearchaeota archaeon]|nr:hypothetical protein [Candidatus Pacearchaeota archaeon]|tara:strand:+ start:6371 stop:7282 length:912 start_codon:yes stop_codon:yes gene_type:complete
MKIKLLDSWEQKGRRSRPIPNTEIINFVNEKVNPKYLYSETVLPTFINDYYEWIQSSTLNQLHGLEKFNQLDFMHGTSQAFDYFYMKHHNKRMRCLRGDYAYHKVSWKNYFNWAYISDDKLRKGDALILSVPFSDLGSEHPDTQDLLLQCDDLNIPVFIDAAYYCIARDVDFNLDRPCIDTVAFSMSKAFYGVERLRVGIRCQRNKPDDGGVLFNQFQCIAKIAAGVGSALCHNFDHDYNQHKFRKKQIEVCKELDICPSDCVLFGITDENHPQFGDYDRGTPWRRVCISTLLGDADEITVPD